MTKQFGEITAVRDLSFAVQPGEIVGLLGPNGSGKTTTLSLCVGLSRPTRGAVRVFGRDVGAARARVDDVGVLLDTPSLHLQLTARENLRYLTLLRGLERDDTDVALETVGLANAASRPVLASRRYSSSTWCSVGQWAWRLAS